MNVSAEWVEKKAAYDDYRVERAIRSSKLKAAYAMPWTGQELIGPVKPEPTEMQAAVWAYRDAYRAKHYQQGDDNPDAAQTAAGAIIERWNLIGMKVVELSDLGETERVERLESDTMAKGSLYLGLCKQQTGETIPDDILEERRSNAVKLIDLSHEIAGRLESQGFEAYRKDQFSLYHFYVHSNHLERIPAFRRVIIVPHVAAMTRNQMLSAAEFFVENHRFCRFWTFTSGRRCKVLEIRQRVKDMHRKLSKLNNQAFMLDAGIEIVLRSTELGTPEEKTDCSTWNNFGEIEEEDGEFYFHPHAHCIVALHKGFINKEKWDLVLKSVWDFWGDQWDDGSVISEVRECLKYVTKPGEMLKLPAATLAELALQLRRLKLAQPMGALADEIKAREANKLRIIRTSTPDGPVLREVFNWNLMPALTDEMKDRIAAEKLSGKKERPFTRVVSRMLPAIGPAGVKEPRVMIMTNETLKVASLRAHPAIAPVIACSQDEFFAGLAIRVHTCTSTVLPGLDILELSSWKPPP